MLPAAGSPTKNSSTAPIELMAPLHRKNYSSSSAVLLTLRWALLVSLLVLVVSSRPYEAQDESSTQLTRHHGRSLLWSWSWLDWFWPWGKSSADESYPALVPDVDLPDVDNSEGSASLPVVSDSTSEIALEDLMDPVFLDYTSQGQEEPPINYPPDEDQTEDNTIMDEGSTRPGDDCRKLENTNLKGELLKTLMGIESAGGCCVECRKMNIDEVKCNVWVYCGADDGCDDGSGRVYPRGRCDLKQQPDLDWENPSAWAAGDGVEWTSGTIGRRTDWANSGNTGSPTSSDDSGTGMTSTGVNPGAGTGGNMGPGTGSRIGTDASSSGGGSGSGSGVGGNTGPASTNGFGFDGQGFGFVSPDDLPGGIGTSESP